jgi:hypothetical protein
MEQRFMMDTHCLQRLQKCLRLDHVSVSPHERTVCLFHIGLTMPLKINQAGNFTIAPTPPYQAAIFRVRVFRQNGHDESCASIRGTSFWHLVLFLERQDLLTYYILNIFQWGMRLFQRVPSMQAAILAWTRFQERWSCRVLSTDPLLILWLVDILLDWPTFLTYLEHFQWGMRLFQPRVPLPSCDLAMYAFSGKMVMSSRVHLSIPHHSASGHLTRLANLSYIS